MALISAYNIGAFACAAGPLKATSYKTPALALKTTNAYTSRAASSAVGAAVRLQVLFPSPEEAIDRIAEPAL
jgi:hypothetical protein